MKKERNKIKHIVVFDIDGVLLDSTHRYRTVSTSKGEKIDLQHWVENKDKCLNDSRLPTAILYDKFLNRQNTFVIIATSRIMLARDYQAIDSLLGFPDSIVSRSTNEQKGGILKIQGIQRVIEDCNLNHINLASNMVIYEDNMKYLKEICDFFKCKGIYIPSNQGY